MNIEKAIAILKDGVNAKTYDEQLEARKLAISALEAQQADRWIAVTEKCPTDYQRLIVYTSDNYLKLSRYNGTDFIDIEYNNLYSHQNEVITNVVAWKPLPAPYKEEQL